MSDERIAKLPKWAQSYIEEIKAQRVPLPYDDPTPLDTEAASQHLGYGSDQVRTAWTYHAYGNDPRVLHGCFNRVHHSVWSTTEARSQYRGGPWYETEQEAARALINRLVEQNAKTINRIRERHKVDSE